jgi:hypothetical protein
MLCSRFSRSGWSVVRNASLAKASTSKKRPSPHLHKVPTRSNKVSPRTFKTALVFQANWFAKNYYYQSKNLRHITEISNIQFQNFRLPHFDPLFTPVSLIFSSSHSLGLNNSRIRFVVNLVMKRWQLSSTEPWRTERNTFTDKLPSSRRQNQPWAGAK